MRDDEIIDLLFERREKALGEVQIKYEAFCHTVSSNILSMREDREECFNEMLLVLWNNIPPERPKSLFAYLSGILRRISKHRARSNNAWKRGGQVQIVNDEFLMLIDDGHDLASDYEAKRTGEIINAFLETVSQPERSVFVMRFIFNESYPRICARTGFTEGKVKMMLTRLRKKLREELGKEGIIV